MLIGSVRHSVRLIGYGAIDDSMPIKLLACSTALGACSCELKIRYVKITGVPQEKYERWRELRCSANDWQVKASLVTIVSAMHDLHS